MPQRVSLSGSIGGIQAMSLALPASPGHPNRMPFSGVLTRVGVASDHPPGGSNGKNIVLTREAAETALPTLMGMGVNLADKMDGHHTQQHVGVITAAHLDRDEISDLIRVEGIIYNLNYPKAAAAIKANKDDLGFSFESQDNYTDDVNGNPLNIVACTFTGASILMKNAAAYRTTSIAASREKTVMDEELKQALAAISASVKEVNDGVTALAVRVEKVETGIAASASKHEAEAVKLETLAGELTAAGVDGSALLAQAALLRSTGKLQAAATPLVVATGGLLEDPAIKKLQDDLAAATTKITTLEAKAALPTGDAVALGAPARRSVAGVLGDGGEIKKIEAAAKEIDPQTQSRLKRYGLSLEACADTDGKLVIEKLNEAMSKANVGNDARMEIKAGLHRAGLV
jgi:hypothetical protein